MKFLFTISVLLISGITIAQDFVTELNGFGLGQYRDVPKNELGKIFQQDKFDDGFEYEIFLVEPDTSVYMIFEYPNYDTNIIWSIQLTGHKIGYDFRFKGLKLGMGKEEVEEILGIPSSIDDMGEYGDKCSYDSTNYNLEILPDGTLAGVKIMDMSNEYFTKSDLSKLIPHDEYSSILLSGKRKSIAKILSPAIEVYKDDSVYFFKHSIVSEIEHDESGIFKLIEEMNAIIENTNFQDSLQYEENMRLTDFSGVLHVAKFKIDDNYSEIVFKYIFGNYLIWEIKLN